MASVHIETYGCSNNIAESQIMERLLREKGFSISDFDNANVVIVNSCSVKSVTENKIIHQLRSIQNNFPEKKLIVAGCMPEAEYDIIKEVVPQASLLSTHHINEVTDVVASVLRDEYVEVMGKARLDKAIMKRQRANPAIDIIPISSGCKSFCTFCSTKIAKGDLFSFPEEHIIESIRTSVKEGTKEFWITSQDNGCYGFDRGTNLAGLIEKITAEIDGNYKLRIGMMNPEHVKKFLPELLEAYKSDKVFKFLHLPVQSGSDIILKKMWRKYSVDDVAGIIKAFKSAIPDITIWTDMICGFPEETEEDFEASMKLIREMKFDFVNISAYGNRPNTPAFRMRQLPTEIKKERTREMSILVEEMSKTQNEKWIGWTGPVMIDEYNEKKGTWIGRNFAYKPVILKGDFALGQDIAVKVTGASQNSLFAVLGGI
ncbi:MAG: tRNA (N(6)-L-threonylcarbamoyladenosine(37)-C(2))-methylthiotransferase [Candidatus Aenigmarchaeota archaeon]|nr:tRNA (N(6)-L-threonylcarbamoyladenosine(37)-C(2))-methylthiotransferase [Candidatus Aenigmarchaeota archaeon]